MAANEDFKYERKKIEEKMVRTKRKLAAEREDVEWQYKKVDREFSRRLKDLEDEANEVRLLTTHEKT